MTPKALRGLRRALLAFYRAHARALPWRATRDPYAIWVSEIMLQQTQVDTVVPRYGEFLRRFPTVLALAESKVETVCEAWAGLGYYRRARSLHAAAVQVACEYGGALPRTVEELRELPGIGRYTAGAIASIAFGEQAPLVDGNVARVLARVFAVEHDPSSTLGQRRLWQLAEQLVVGERPGDLNQALMELGATICRVRAPACTKCPVRRHCAGHAAGDPTRLPRPAPKVRRGRLQVAFALLEERGGAWLVQRPLSGLWGGLWELPSATGPSAAAQLGRLLGGVGLVEQARLRHELTHKRVEACVFRPNGPWHYRGDLPLRWYPSAQAAPVSTLARKAWLAASAGQPRRGGKAGSR